MIKIRFVYISTHLSRGCGQVPIVDISNYSKKTGKKNSLCRYIQIWQDDKEKTLFVDISSYSNMTGKRNALGWYFEPQRDDKEKTGIISRLFKMDK